MPLIRAERFILTAGEQFVGLVQLAQFGAADLADVALNWTLGGRDGTIFASGMLSAGRLATGHLHDIGRIEIATGDLASPAEYELVIELAGTQFRNRWSLWVFEPAVADTELATIGVLDDASLARIVAGETLVLTPEPGSLKPNAVLGHTTVFWNTLWTNGQEPHTLGLLNDTSHPVFEYFPARRHSDWHWWELTHRRRAFDIGGVRFRPIVRVIDDWNQNRDLALFAEARIGKGRLILSAADIASDLQVRPVARSFRNALAAYAAGPSAEAPEVTAAEVGAWWDRIKS